MGDSLLEQSEVLRGVGLQEEGGEDGVFVLVGSFGLCVFPPLVEDTPVETIEQSEIDLPIVGRDGVPILFLEAFEAFHLPLLFEAPQLVLLVQVHESPDSEAHPCIMKEAVVIDAREILPDSVVLERVLHFLYKMDKAFLEELAAVLAVQTAPGADEDVGLLPPVLEAEGQ